MVMMLSLSAIGSVVLLRAPACAAVEVRVSPVVVHFTDNFLVLLRAYEFWYGILHMFVSAIPKLTTLETTYTGHKFEHLLLCTIK